MDRHLLDILVCPIDHTGLIQNGTDLVCSEKHVFPLIDGIPVLLDFDEAPTHGDLFKQTLAAVRDKSFDTIKEVSTTSIDKVVQQEIAGTCGLFYRGSNDNFTEYPLPEIIVPPGKGFFLDIGCGWGRWCFAAAEKGYTPIGIDPNINYVMAARRAMAFT